MHNRVLTDLEIGANLLQTFLECLIIPVRFEIRSAELQSVIRWAVAAHIHVAHLGRQIVYLSIQVIGYRSSPTWEIRHCRQCRSV